MRPSNKRRPAVQNNPKKAANCAGSDLPPDSPGRLPRVFAGLFGAFLGLSLLKFGNPPIMEKWVTLPENGYEFLLGYPWPMTWAFLLLAIVTIVGLFIPRTKSTVPRWLLALPLIWFGWQLLSALQTVDSELTKSTVRHFAACLVCFYLGCLVLNQIQRIARFWTGLLCGFVLVLAVGWNQHFGGLEETRRYFFLYIYPTMKEVQPGYLQKMASNRIFATLFYPNALAGALILFLPLTLGLLEAARQYLTKPAKWFLQSLSAIGALGCLFWSGSKGGWLLMLFLGLLTLQRLPFNRNLKLAVATMVLVAGLAGFFWKYSGFFHKGATSVSARFDYWHAAVQTAKTHPVFGTGPGTFFIPYSAIKRPESEPSRLVHNDYLEQASDSGIPALLAYGAFIVGALILTFKRTAREPLAFAVWLGLLGWALQSLLEFGLYIPALAWPAFTLFGWLVARPVPGIQNPIDSPASGD